jgi:hypothetical protein
MSKKSKMSEDELWLLSFYRSSEINGALFFGRLARSMRSGEIQRDMTKHFADESMHAWYWTQCIEDLDSKPIKLLESYQDEYLAAAGFPTNVMEVLAITQVFEKRVIGQYSRHRVVEGLNPRVAQTIETIMEDEKWHIQWIGDALKSLHAEYGKELVESTLKRFHAADVAVYDSVMKEHEERMEHLFGKKR